MSIRGNIIGGNIDGSLNITGETNITDTTQSTSTNTGALIVAGGISIAKNLNIGGILQVSSQNTDTINAIGTYETSFFEEIGTGTSVNADISSDGLFVVSTKTAFNLEVIVNYRPTITSAFTNSTTFNATQWIRGHSTISEHGDWLRVNTATGIDIYELTTPAPNIAYTLRSSWPSFIYGEPTSMNNSATYSIDPIGGTIDRSYRIYKRSGSTWSLVNTLVSSTGTSTGINHYNTCGIDYSGNRVVITGVDDSTEVWLSNGVDSWALEHTFSIEGDTFINDAGTRILIRNRLTLKSIVYTYTTSWDSGVLIDITSDYSKLSPNGNYVLLLNTGNLFLYSESDNWSSGLDISASSPPPYNGYTLGTTSFSGIGWGFSDNSIVSTTNDVASVLVFTITNINIVTNTSIVNMTDTTQSSNITSGALIVSGGVGIAKNLSMSGDFQLNSSATNGGSITFNSSSLSTTGYTLTFPPEQGGFSEILTNDGSGGLSWGSADASGTVTSNNSFGTDNRLLRTFGTSGSVIEQSGISISDVDGISGVSTLNTSGDSTIGGLFNVSSNTTIGGILKINSTLDSTSSTSNGALVVAGGAIIGKNLVIGGDLIVEGTTTTINSTTTTIIDPMFKVADGNPADTSDFGFYGEYVSGGNTTYSGLHRVGGDSTPSNPEVSGKWLLFDGATTEPGPLNVGDAGVAGDLVVGGLYSTTLDVTGVLTIADNTTSTNTSTGALKVAGGVGIGENVNIGGTLNVSGNSTISSFNASANSTIGGSLIITDTTESTSTGNGALIVSGGVSIDKGLILGGKLSLNIRTVGDIGFLDDDYILNVNASTNGSTITLPDITSDQYNGVAYLIIKTTANNVDVTTQSADKIIDDGTEVNTISLDGSSGERIHVISNGLKWYVI